MKLFTTWPEMKQEIENYIKKCEMSEKQNYTTQSKIAPTNYHHTRSCLGKMLYGYCRSFDSYMSQIHTDVSR